MKKGTIRVNAPTQPILINFDKRGDGGGWDEIQSFRNGTLFYKHRNRKTGCKKTINKKLSRLTRHGKHLLKSTLGYGNHF